MGSARLASATSLVALSFACAQDPERFEHARAPHVVVLVADDLGWSEVGFQGGAVPTPHLDRLAREGVVLERFYGQPVCSASRAALLTGRDPMRYGMAGAVIAPWQRAGLPEREVTLAEALAERGYAHRAAFGKWHLGHLERRWHPLSQGFTRFHGHYNGAIDHFTHERDGERDWHLDHEPLREEGYATALAAGAAADYIAAHAHQGPLLCYVALSAAHAPFQAPAATLERFAEIAGDGDDDAVRQARAAMLAEVDDAVGRVLGALERAGVADDTLVWFLADNGAGAEQPDANEPLRGHKLGVHEGGLRVPAALRWPSGLPAGARVAQATSVLDVFPTALRAAGGEPARGAPLDGVDLLEALRGRAEFPARELYFFYGQEGPQDEQVAVREGDWKLVVRGPDLRQGPSMGSLALDLFMIDEDPEERRDLTSERPDVAQRLLARAAAYRSLEPEDALPAYWEGYEGFRVPALWRVPHAE